MLRFLILFFSFFIASLSVQAAVTTGPIANAVTLAYKPQAVVDTMGLSRLSVPVLAGDTAGMATIGARSTALKLLGAAGRGALGPLGLAAITAAQLCYEHTDWKVCHSSIEPIVPINIDTSKIIAATKSTVSTYFVYGISSYTMSNSSGFLTPELACRDVVSFFNSKYVGTYQYSYVSSTINSCTVTSIIVSSGSSRGNDVFSLTVYGNQDVYTCSSGSNLTNSSGAPMAVTGNYCTPDSSYSCPENYSRSDSYGNLSSDGMFCSYQAPVLTDQQKSDILAPYLLNYYANQLFSDNNGKPLTDIYTDSDTTFDPTVTPANMPMTWTQLQQYVDWYINGKAQTTNPLAPYYISPSNYSYTQNYVNTTNSTNTNTDSTTNVSPTTTASSAAMTQEQYETSTKKLDDAAATAINATDTSSLENLTKTSGFDGANDQLTNISNGNISDLPSLPTPNLPGYSNCQTIDLSWKGNPAVFPSPSQCGVFQGSCHH